MGKSARILGQEYGLTAQEMNFILKEEGYLDGEPGSYTVTEKGEKYATEEDHHRGTGGYARYNRYWTTRTWNEEITDELDITDDRKKELRQAISVAKQKIYESAEDEKSFEMSDNDTYVSEENDDDSDALVVAIGALLLAASAYGIYKAAPYIKKWWSEKAVPGLKKLKSKVVGGTEKNEIEPVLDIENEEEEEK